MERTKIQRLLEDSTGMYRGYRRDPFLHFPLITSNGKEEKANRVKGLRIGFRAQAEGFGVWDPKPQTLNPKPQSPRP